MRFESKGQAFHERLREAFLAIASAEPERCAVIDAARRRWTRSRRAVWARGRARGWRRPMAELDVPIRATSSTSSGDEAAEARLRWTPLARGRLHHAWLLTGPEGVGKATFAYRAARRLLGAPADPAYGLLGADPDDPVSRQVIGRARTPT